MKNNISKKKHRKSHYPINKINIFDGRDSEDFSFTNHFFERWNERVASPSFEEKADMEEYIKSIYRTDIITHISGDYYFLDNLIITADMDRKHDSIVFITVYGTIEDNIILYNILVTEGVKGVKKATKRYGKINLLPS